MERSPTTMHCDAAGSDAAADAAPAKRRTRARKPAPATSLAAAQPAAEAPPADTTVVPAPSPVIHGEHVAPAAPCPSGDSRMPAEEFYQRIGHLTRTLHDALRGLGYDKELQGTREQLPDARDRLSYIARVTGEAAEKVLNSVDRARSVQEEMTVRATNLRTRWQAVAVYAAHEASRATPAGRALMDETVAYFDGVCGQTDATQAILTDIMMAQDFHDLTGQVIRKVVTLATNMEEQLLKLLLESTPPEQRKKLETERPAVVAAVPTGATLTERLEGPVVRAEGRDDVVTDQAGVDDLLASLGF